MHFDPNRVRANAQRATTEDLLDRVTVYRSGLEADAVPILEAELHKRGIGPEAIEAHRGERGTYIQLADGSAVRCSFCDRPAILRAWGWHRLWGQLPIFPRLLYYCEKHR
jgi:hypothetical protein